MATLGGGQIGQPLDAHRLASSWGADQQRRQAELPGWGHDQAPALPAGQVTAERRPEGVGVQPPGLPIREPFGLAPSPLFGPLAAALLSPLELGRDQVTAAGGEAGGQEPGRDGQGELGPQDRPERWSVEAGRSELLGQHQVAREVVGDSRDRSTGDEHDQGAPGHGWQGEPPAAPAGVAQECLAGDPGDQDERRQEERHEQ
jgi:hypothetical protein